MRRMGDSNREFCSAGKDMAEAKEQVVVCALYKFTRLDDYMALRAPLQSLLSEHSVKGSLLLANEGINGTVAGSREGIDALRAWLSEDSRFDGAEIKESLTERMPFPKAKVRLKKEIVTMGVDGIDPNDVVGTYVEPEDWNALISDPDVILIDTRNDYEVEIGTFATVADRLAQGDVDCRLSRKYQCRAFDALL